MTETINVCWFCKKTISAWDLQTQEAWCFLINETYIYVHKQCCNEFIRKHIAGWPEES